MNLIPKDTTIDALRKQFEILERIGIEGRAEMTFQLSDNLRQIIEDGVRFRNPEYSDDQVRQEVLRRALSQGIRENGIKTNDRTKKVP
jgi:hypothetical protein